MTINLEPTLRPFLRHLEQLEHRNAELEERLVCLEANRGEANSPIQDANWAAEYLGIRRSTLNNWIAQRKLPVIHYGGRPHFTRRLLDEWLAKHVVPDVPAAGNGHAGIGPRRAK